MPCLATHGPSLVGGSDYTGRMSRQVAARQTTSVDVDDGSANILHVDMDAFFASVELLDHPELRDRPVAVAYDGPRSVISAANYVARRYGVGSAMPLAAARKRCANLVVLEPRGHLYRHYNRIVMQIFSDITPQVEPLSIDEAFLDVSGARRLFGSAGLIAQRLRERMVAETGLTCSVGVAASKYVAKVASTQSKPDGLLIVPASRTLAFLHPLPVSALWGVGAVSAKKLAGLGLDTIGDVADTPVRVLERALGVAAARQLTALANGVDHRSVAALTSRRIEKSISQETTFETDVSDPAVIERFLLQLSQGVSRRLRHAGVVASTISIKLRTSDFATASRSRTLGEPTAVSRTVAETAVDLYRASGLHGQPLRLVGVRGENLRDVGDGAAAGFDMLWDDEQKWRAADATLDTVETRFGRDAVLPASLLRDANLRPDINRKSGGSVAGENEKR